MSETAGLTRYDVAIARGDTTPFEIQLMRRVDPADPNSALTPYRLPSGTIVVLGIQWKTGSIQLSSANQEIEVIEAAGYARWTPTVEQSRSIPPGFAAQYQWQFRYPNGLRKSYFYGFLNGEGGLIND